MQHGLEKYIFIKLKWRNMDWKILCTCIYQTQLTYVHKLVHKLS